MGSDGSASPSNGRRRASNAALVAATGEPVLRHFRSAVDNFRCWGAGFEPPPPFPDTRCASMGMGRCENLLLLFVYSGGLPTSFVFFPMLMLELRRTARLACCLFSRRKKKSNNIMENYLCTQAAMSQTAHTQHKKSRCAEPMTSLPQALYKRFIYMLLKCVCKWCLHDR